MTLKNHFPFWLFTSFLLLTSLALAGFQDETTDQMRQEEQEDYYEKWLKEDVLYIISEEEKEIFQNLNTPEEKEQFIEQFWFRRDPNPRTALNEFKEEHYRRIAYANENFAWAKPGWMTDRGRIYIIHGPPDSKETHPSGGPYDREIWEGGGSTITFPFEVWWYRYVENVGNDVTMEFIDPTLTGEYHLALRPEEKDALLTTPGVGLTMAELDGYDRSELPYFDHDARTNQKVPGFFLRSQDNPFERYKRHVKMQAAPIVKYNDLKEMVEVNLSYEELPFRVRQDYIKLDDTHVIVPVTIQIENSEVTFENESPSVVARMGVYGLVTSLSNQIVDEFEDDIRTRLPAAQLEKGLSGVSVYQKTLVLERKGRYKLDLVVKDLASGKVGARRLALTPPKIATEGLAHSSMILSSSMSSLPEIPSGEEMFVIGDLKIRPSVDKVFPPAGSLAIYMQLYNVPLDQTSLEPSLRITYSILKGPKVIARAADEQGQSVQFYSGQRVVLVSRFALGNLDPGDYTVQIDVEDRIEGLVLQTREEFKVEENALEMAAER